MPFIDALRHFITQSGSRLSAQSIFETAFGTKSRLWLRGALLCAWGAACSSPREGAVNPTDAGDDPTVPSDAPSTALSDAGPSHTAPSDTELSDAGPSLPDTAAGEQLAWVLELVNERDGVAAQGELATHFHESFLQQVPLETLEPMLADIAATLAPLVVQEVAPESSALQLVTLVDASQGRIVITLSLDAESGQINGLLFSPLLDLETRRPKTWQEVEDNVRGLAPESEFLVAQVDAAGCHPLHAQRAASRLAIGSSFKLYVLAETAQQVTDGLLDWDTQVSVQDALKSLPSGVLQDEPEGTKVSVRELAEAMISISDNTATDHLIDLLGRENVEQRFALAGHGAPELNVPLLFTREFFLLKLELSDAGAADYVASDVAARREFLQTLVGQTPNLAAAENWSAPRYIEEIEWFANVDDLCAVMATLLNMSEQPGLAPILDILALNPGLPAESIDRPYIGFKGGSEIGVLQLTWLVRDSNGVWNVVALSLNDVSAPIADEELALSTALGMFELLAAE
jgi:beta-lactamase class A